MALNTLNSSQAARNNKWVYEHQFSPENKTTLICFPYAGGNSHAFSGWKEFLPKNWNILAVQYPGRMGLISSPPETNVLSLVTKLYKEILPFVVNDNVIFFGHSLGALVSFELVKYIEKMKDITIDALCVSACVSPELVGNKEGIYHLSDDEFLIKISGYGGTPNEILKDKDLMQFFLPVLKSDFCMYETYSHNPKERISPPILAFGSPDDPYAPVNDMLNWKKVSSSNSELITVLGDHFFLHNSQSNFPDRFQQSINCLFSGELHNG